MMAMSLWITGCGHGQLLGPTLTPTSTVTFTPTSTPTQTSTSTPTVSATPMFTRTSIPTKHLKPNPTSLAYVAVPRWMIFGQPGYSVEILGEKWNYTNDNWGETAACIDYTREKGPNAFFEECFGAADDKVTFESLLAPFLKDKFETLTPTNSFDDIAQIALVAKRLEENSQKFVKFFELIGTPKYNLLLEMNVTTDDTASLQSIYESQAADTIDYVLQNGLQKSRILPQPTSTPLSATQEILYASLAKKLITELEASKMYGGTWESLGDRVSNEGTRVCRDFEDRTNADVRWVSFKNCAYVVDKDHTFQSFVDFYQQRGYVVLNSRHKFNDKYALFVIQDGHTFFDVILIHGAYIYLVGLESRTLAGEKAEDVFTKDVDDFLYGVLMANVQK